MVVLHLKRTEQDQFLFETSCSESNDSLIRRLVRVWNMRIRLARLADAAEQLAEYGVAKPEEERGLDEKTVRMAREVEAATPGGRPLPAAAAAAAAAAASSGAGAASAAAASGDGGDGWRVVSDPTEQRVGLAPPTRLSETIKTCCAEARAAIHRDQVAKRVALTERALQDCADNIRGAVTMAYPGGLPDFDPVRLMIEDKEDLSGMAAALDLLEEESAQLWWAGKEFSRDRTVGDLVGRNEKTKIVARLQKKGAGPPVREPAVSEAERRAMMSHYFKKQQELKELAENDDDEFLASSWADSRSLKRNLVGAGAIRFR